MSVIRLKHRELERRLWVLWQDGRGDVSRRGASHGAGARTASTWRCSVLPGSSRIHFSEWWWEVAGWTDGWPVRSHLTRQDRKLIIFLDRH